jgi:hypothetical protein
VDEAGAGVGGDEVAGEERAGLAKKPPRWCIGWRATVPASSAPLKLLSGVTVPPSLPILTTTGWPMRPPKLSIRSRATRTVSVPASWSKRASQ